MGDTIVIETPVATVLEVSGLQGPQGVPGASQADVLTVQGDLLYRGASAAQRLGIGTAGQILKVNSGGTAPEWGAAPAPGVTSVNGDTGAVTITPASIDAAESNHAHNSADLFFAGLEILGAGNVNTNGVYIYSGDYNGKGTYYKNKDSLIYWDGAAWMIMSNANDIYSSAQNTTTPWQVTSWSVEAGQTSPAPSSWDRVSGDQWEAVVGQRINPTLRGSAAGKDVGTGANDVAAGNHTHGNLTNDGKLGSTAGLPVVTTTAGAVTTLALGTANQVLRVNSGATGVEFADPAASGVTGAASSASDVLGVSGANITGVDATADRIVFWDDSASKLAYLEAGSGLSISGTTMTVTATGGAINLWIAASQFIPRTTNGCGVDSRETSTNRQNFDELLFDAGTDEFAQALIKMPSNYNNGTITARFYWTASSGSGSVVWGIQGRAFADDDALDAAAGTAQTVTDTLLAANDMHVSSATSAVTIGGTPAANTPIQFQIFRDADSGSDSLAVDARLLGVEIIFN